MSREPDNLIDEREFDRLLSLISGNSETHTTPAPVTDKKTRVSGHGKSSATIITHTPVYAAHFGLRRAPFSLTPDTRFFHAHGNHLDALNTLLVALRSNEGFSKVTSEVGTGKTLLCRMLLQKLDRRFVTAYIPNPYLDPSSLLLAIADELGIDCPRQASQQQILKSLCHYMVDNYAQGRAIVVCLDEAHAMPEDTLEALRLLSNLETQQRKLIQLVLFGQPELNTRLNRPSVRQLQQRISFSCRLLPLTQEEITAYIEHRLTVAGCRSGDVFSRAALRQLFKASQGTHRLVNILAHKAMMSAFGSGDVRVGKSHVRDAIEDTEAVQQLNSRRTRHWLGFLSRAGANTAGRHAGR